ncbi:hypothetical protein AYO42_00865 [Rhizomicrobium sp. SCGC AG-212-E05]|nr:hypothetical protein AYO42_00865 [Rhizomicrobium sp. SCGC AG-212-E05]
MERRPEKMCLVAGIVLICSGFIVASPLSFVGVADPLFGIPLSYVGWAEVLVGMILIAQFCWLKRKRLHS